jgi:putative PEP-CTERM system TPR-repeat lipoprotein
VSHHTVLSSNTVWRRALLAAAAAGILIAPVRAYADVPPSSYRQGSSADRAKVDALVAEAEKTIKAGNVRAALIALKNAVSADPGNGPVRVRLGLVLLQMGDEPGAERELRQARKDGAPELVVLPVLFGVMLARNENQLLLDQFPDPGAGPKGPAAADILKGRALALQSLKRPSEATDAMDRSLALRRDANGLLTHARLSLLQGNAAEARTFADEAIGKSNRPDAMLFKVGLLLATNDNQAALDLANQLLAKFPGNLQGRFARIEAYIGLRQDAKAKPEVDDILAKYPNAHLGSYYRAVLLARAGDAKGAWSIAQNLPGDFRDSQPRIAAMVAQMAVDAGNEETGASILGRILLKDPNMGTVRLRLAAIRMKQNSPAEVLSVLEPIKGASDSRVLELLSNAYLRLHRNNDALNVLQKMDANGKGRTDVKRSIALLEIQMGRVDQGIKDLAQVVSREPTNPSLVAPLIEALARAQRFPEALAAADRLGSDPKQRVTALVFRGDILTLQHNNADAQAAFDKAINTDPRNITALYSRAEFLAAMQRPAEANRDLRAILSQDGKNLSAFLKLAEIAARQGEDQNVRSLLGQAIAGSPDSAAPRLVLVRYLIARKDFKNALTAANDLVRTQPKNTDGLVLLGQAQFALGQKMEAVASYRRLVSLLPMSAGPQIFLGNALSAAGDRAGAARAMEAAVKLNPNAAQVRGAQINFQFIQGDANAAVAAARAFQVSNPGTEADLLLADTLDRAKLPAQAVAVLSKSLSDRPSNVAVLQLVRFATRANDNKRAANLMSTWLASHPDDAMVRLQYATLSMQEEDTAQATAQYQIILKKDPNNIVALNNLGWLLQESDPKRALSMLTLALKLSPTSSDVIDTLGWLKIQQKDAAGGLALLSQAHAMQPKDGEITYHLVLALDANSKRDAARGLLKALLASNAAFKDRPAAVRLSTTWH